MIIHNPAEEKRLNFDKEYTLTVSDWYGLPGVRLQEVSLMNAQVPPADARLGQLLPQ